MFYLDKRLSTLVNRISPARRPVEEPRAESRIGFSIETPGALEDVERIGGTIPRSIARSGSDFIYLLGSGMKGIGPLESRQMSLAKSSVIEELSKGTEDVGMASFRRAREIAAREIRPHLDGERADDRCHRSERRQDGVARGQEEGAAEAQGRARLAWHPLRG